METSSSSAAVPESTKRVKQTHKDFSARSVNVCVCENMPDTLLQIPQWGLPGSLGGGEIV